MIGLGTTDGAMSGGSSTPAEAGSTNIQAGGEASDSSLSQKADTNAGATEPESGKPNLSGKVAPKTAGVTGDAASQYQPNFKFKVLDKEREIDDWAKTVIKDADTEKKVRELYEKAYGLDSVKQDRETLRSELSQAKEKMANTDRAIETISEYARSKDWDSFFESLSIPKQDILQYALQLVQREQMPPEQKAQWEASRRAQQEARYYQEQNLQLQQSQQQFQVQQREFELSQVLSKPDVSVIAEAYNAGMANPGAFREYVIRIGQAHAARGEDITAEAAAQEAIRHLRAVNPSLGQVAQQGQPANVVMPNAKPTIPNIQGRGTSPVKSSVRSLDDLRAKAKEFQSSSVY